MIYTGTSQSVCHRSRPCSNEDWPPGSLLLRFQITQQSALCYFTIEPQLWDMVNYTRDPEHYILRRIFKIVTDHRAIWSLSNFKDPDNLSARWLKNFAAIDFEIEHQSVKSIEHANCVAQLLPPAAAVNTATTIDVDPSADGQLKPPG